MIRIPERALVRLVLLVLTLGLLAACVPLPASAPVAGQEVASQEVAALEVAALEVAAQEVAALPQPTATLEPAPAAVDTATLPPTAVDTATPEPTAVDTATPASTATATRTPARAARSATAATATKAPTKAPTRVAARTPTRAPAPTATIDRHRVVITEADITRAVASGAGAQQGVTVEDLQVRFTGGKTHITADSLGYGFVQVRNLDLVGRLVAANGVLSLQVESISPRGLVANMIPNLANQALAQYGSQWYVEEVQTLEGRVELRIR